ncbi:MAG TPA: MBL fold metallo-hydrolase [Sphingobium sp.]|nr:MBL fold metallo-hydrolase [Sphingobium sp.]
MLKLTVLGCGTSSGVPRLGPDWGDCDPTEPRNRRSRASIVVESPTTRILVDTGPDLREQLIAARITAIDAVLWTHDHADHCHGLDDLRQLAQMRRKPIKGYTNRQTLSLLQKRFTYAFEGREYYPPIITASVLPDRGSTIGDIAVTYVDQPHGDIYSLGFRFDHDSNSVGYSTDFHEFTEEMLETFSGIDVWVVDALREQPHPTHAHLSLTLQAIARARPRRSVLTHMDTSMDYAALASRLPPGVEPGFDGLTISVGQSSRQGSVTFDE